MGTKFTKNILSASGSDDDLSAHWSNPNLNTWVSIFSKLSGKHFIQLREKYTISDKLQQKHIPT